MRFDAAEFLKSLYDPAPPATLADLPAEWYEAYRERASIMEFTGGLPRELAEHYALLDTLEFMRSAPAYLPY